MFSKRLYVDLSRGMKIYAIILSALLTPVFALFVAFLIINNVSALLLTVLILFLLNLNVFILLALGIAKAQKSQEQRDDALVLSTVSRKNILIFLAFLGVVFVVSMLIPILLHRASS